MKTQYTVGQEFDFKIGDKVIANGFEGRVIGLQGSAVEVKLSSGEIEVSASFPDCYPA